MAADPKPARRVVDPKAQPLDQAPLLRGQCPLCARHVPLTRHHVVPKGQGGDDLPVNLVWVCGHGTKGCHGVLTHRNRDGETGLTFDTVGQRLLHYIAPEVKAYANRKKWPGFLEGYYGLKEAA